MTPPREPPQKERHESGPGVFRYAVGWVIAGALAAVGVVGLLGPDDEVALPPLRETQLEQAAQVAGCELRAARGREQLNPPVTGVRGTSPAKPGVYEDALPDDALVSALRRGTIVIHYGSGLPESRQELLEDLQRAVPDATIVVRNASNMRFAIAATAWRRLLGCRRFDDRSVDALRLFRGRFVGSGPDAP